MCFSLFLSTSPSLSLSLFADNKKRTFSVRAVAEKRFASLAAAAAAATAAHLPFCARGFSYIIHLLSLCVSVSCARSDLTPKTTLASAREHTRARAEKTSRVQSSLRMSLFCSGSSIYSGSTRRCIPYTREREEAFAHLGLLILLRRSDAPAHDYRSERTTAPENPSEYVVFFFSYIYCSGDLTAYIELMWMEFALAR